MASAQKAKGFIAWRERAKASKEGTAFEVDRNLFRQTVGRLTVNDLDVETRQMRGRRR
jgi:hypothetical protein